MAKHRVDFSEVEAFTLCEEGEHIAQFEKYEETVSKDGDVRFKSTFLITAGTSKGARVIDNFVLNDKALWKLKMFLESVGISADKKMVIDPDKWIGKKCIIEVAHHEYQGTARSSIATYKKLIVAKKKAEEAEEEDWEDEEEEEETPPVKTKKDTKTKAKAKKKPEPEDDDDEWDEEE